jgi:hypothetical protein
MYGPERLATQQPDVFALWVSDQNDCFIRTSPDNVDEWRSRSRTPIVQFLERTTIIFRRSKAIMGRCVDAGVLSKGIATAWREKRCNLKKRGIVKEALESGNLLVKEPQRLLEAADLRGRDRSLSIDTSV